jgi:hypothetical protein
MAIQASAVPRLSPSGRRIVAGEKSIVVDQSIDVGPGTSGQWGDDEQVFYTRQADGAFMEWHNGSIATVINGGFNAFSVGGKNRWAGYSAARGVVQFDNGTIVPGWSGPALSDDASVWAAVIHARGEIVTSHGRPQRFADRDCRDLRWCGRALVWNVYVLGRWQIAGCREPGAVVDLLNIEPEEFAPVPLLVNGELWLMTHSNDRLLLRPWGLRTGYVVATGITNTPDAKQLPDGRVRVVWDAGHNVLGDITIDLATSPMIGLERPAPDDEPIIDRESVVDVLDYLPIGVALDGSHLYACRYTGQQPNVFSIAKHPDGGGEWWAHDDAWVYHHLDQGGSPIQDVAAGQFNVRRDANGNRIDAYYFADDARWMPRRVKTGDTLTVETRIYRIADGSSEPWRHVNRFEVFSSYPSPIGTGRALVMTYDPRRHRDPNGRLQGRYEKGVYVVVHGRKYHRWEDWRTKDDNSGDELMQQTEFQQVDTAPAVTWRLSRRPASAKLLPDEDEMNAPGVTVDRYGSVIGPTGTWSVEFHDRNNVGISGKVEIVNGSVHVTMTNPEGSDRSGNRRPVEVRGV